MRDHRGILDYAHNEIWQWDEGVIYRMSFEKPSPVVGEHDRAAIRWEDNGSSYSYGSTLPQFLAPGVESPYIPVPPQVLPVPPLAEVLAAAVRLGVVQGISERPLPFGQAMPVFETSPQVGATSRRTMTRQRRL